MYAQSRPADCTSCPTRNVCLANHVATERLALFETILTHRKPLSRDDYLYRAGDPANEHYYTRSGMFKTFATNAAGDEQVTGFSLPGESIGHAQSGGEHTDTAVALETATACVLADEDVERLFEAGIARAFYKRLAERDSRFAFQQLNLTQSRADARVAGYLLDFSRRLARLGRCPNHIPTPMSRTDIANYIGLTLETLSRVVSRMTRSGVVRASKDAIEILRPNELQLLGLHII